MTSGEVWFRSIFDSVTDAIFVHDALTGDVLDVNRRACEIFGYTAEEFRRLGLGVLGMDEPPYTREDTVAWVTKAAASGRELFNWQSRTSDGRLISQEVSLQAASLDGRDCVLATVRDVTERQKTQAALVESEERVRTSEERLRAVLSSSPLGVALIDRDEIVQIWNPAMEQIFGWTAVEVLGQPWPAVPPAKSAESADLQRRWMRGESLSTVDLVRQGKDGSRVDLEAHFAPVLDVAGVVIGSMAIMRDVAEEKRIQEQLESQANTLRERDEELQAVIQAAPIAIIRVDPEERVMLWNPAAEEMFGWTEEEVLGRPIPFVSPELREESDRHLELSLRGESVWGEEIVRRRKDGSLVECQRWTVPMYGRDGSVVGIMGLLRGIAQEKRMQAMLRQSQKMEAVGRLAGGIAHDFNNLLTAIIGYSDLALANAEPDCPSRDDVREIKRAAERASGLTRQILAFSRRQPLQPKLLSLSRTLQGMDSLLRRTLGEDIDFQIRLDSDVGLTQVDPHQLEQVLMNLAVNARDAMPEGGSLIVETANVELGEPYRAAHPDVHPGPYVMLAVSDTGRGMDAETMSHLFEPFFTTKPLGEGTGLGLSTVYGIVKQSGGDVAVQSAPGRGSTFRIYLPRVDGPAPAGHLPATFAPGETPPQATILVVEDETSVRALVCRVLARQGYSILEAGNGPAAMRALDESGQSIDLLLTDVMLPGGVLGHVLAERLTASRPHLRVLYMSGYARDAIVHDGRLDEGVDLLEKPFTPEVLVDRVREALLARTPTGLPRAAPPT